MKEVCRKICETFVGDKLVSTYLHCGLYYEDVEKTEQETFETFEQLFSESNGYTTIPYNKFLFWRKRVVIYGNTIDNVVTVITEKNFKPIAQKYSFRKATNTFSIDDLAKRLNCKDFLQWARDNKFFSEYPLTK
jgi:hypothetical protein